MHSSQILHNRAIHALNYFQLDILKIKNQFGIPPISVLVFQLEACPGRS